MFKSFYKKTLILILGIIFLSSFFPFKAFSQVQQTVDYDYPDFLDEYEIGNAAEIPSDQIERAVTIANETANQELFYPLGHIYLYGKGISKDYKEAEQWLLKAAKIGNFDAMVELGRLYKYGSTDGVIPRATSKALEYFGKAAKEKNVYALYEMGIMYEYGLGVFQDFKKALEYYNEAAQLGFKLAHAKLGNFYKYGIGTEKNFRQAVMHFQFLYENAVNVDVKEYAKLKLGSAFYEIAMQAKKENGDKPINETNDIVKNFTLAAELGDVKAQLELGSYYMASELKTYDKAFYWFKKAAENGSIYAMVNVGYLYKSGLGVKKSSEMAFEWYKTAAERGSAEGAWNVGVAYTYGDGVNKNVEEGKKWFARAEELKKKD